MNYTFKKKNHNKYEVQGEFKRIKPLVFDGEMRFDEAKEWILGMSKHFILYDYSGNMKAKMEIYNLNRRASIWWNDLKTIKHISEK